MDNEQLWTRDFITLSVINFLVFLSYFLLMVTIAAYAVDKFGSSTSTAGLVAGIFIIGALIGRLGAGRIIGAIGSKRLLTAGTVSFVITSAAYFAADGLPLLILIRLLHGIAFGLASTATGTIVVQIVPAWRQGEGIAFYSISAVLGVALGPFIGVYLAHHADFQVVFLVVSLLALVGCAIAFLIGEPVTGSSGQDPEEEASGFQLSKFIEYRAVPISLILLILCLSYSVVVAFIALYTKEIHLEKAASLYFLSYSAAVLISRPFSGRLLDERGANFVVYPCLLIYAVGMLLFSQANHGITFLLAGAILGLGYGNLISCAQAISIKSVPPHRLGLAIATFFTFVDLGFGMGPYLLGYLVPFTGYRGLYSLMILVTLGAAVLYYFWLGKKMSYKPAEG